MQQCTYWHLQDVQDALKWFLRMLQLGDGEIQLENIFYLISVNLPTLLNGKF